MGFSLAVLCFFMTHTFKTIPCAHWCMEKCFLCTLVSARLLQWKAFICISYSSGFKLFPVPFFHGEHQALYFVCPDMIYCCASLLLGLHWLLILVKLNICCVSVNIVGHGPHSFWCYSTSKRIFAVYFKSTFYKYRHSPQLWLPLVPLRKKKLFLGNCQVSAYFV